MVEAVLLGVAQDAGVPQIGCDCATCAAARANSAHGHHPVSLGLIDHDARRFWIIDATPAFAAQYDRLRTRHGGYAFGGVLLTHAHMGHYTGLVQLGKEALNAKGVPVRCTPSLAAFLRTNQPWEQLIRIGNIVMHEVDTGLTHAPTELSPDLRVQALGVPHRNELSDTVAYVINGPRRALLYLPDIDGWDGAWADLPTALRSAGVRVALLDGCFYSADELPRMAQVPHPLVTDSLARLVDRPCEVVFVHLNHTNPLLREGPERDAVVALGFGIGMEGMSWSL